VPWHRARPGGAGAHARQVHVQHLPPGLAFVVVGGAPLAMGRTRRVGTSAVRPDRAAALGPLPSHRRAHRVALLPQPSEQSLGRGRAVPSLRVRPGLAPPERPVPGVRKGARRLTRPRPRAVLKWMGLSLCVLIFAVWLVSGWWNWTITHVSPSGF